MKLFAILACAVVAQDYYGYDDDSSVGNRDNAADAGPAAGAKNYPAPPAAPATLSCWTCRNAYSYAQCEAEGSLVTCQTNQVSHTYESYLYIE